MFYDLAKDGSRLTGEWIQGTPANWYQTYVAPHHCYRYTTIGAIEYCTLMSEPDAHDFEAEMLFYATNADAMVGMSIRKARSTVGTAGEVCMWLTGGIVGLEFQTTAGATPVLATAVYVVDITKWHRLKVRVVGRKYYCKVWVEGTSEPDWMIAQNVAYNEMRLKGTIAIRGGIRTAYFSNIMWRPIPRVGGLP